MTSSTATDRLNLFFDYRNNPSMTEAEREAFRSDVLRLVAAFAHQHRVVMLSAEDDVSVRDAANNQQMTVYPEDDL